MRYLRLTSVILIGFMISGCATAWVVAEARKPGPGDISATVYYEGDIATITWKRKTWVGLADFGYSPTTTGITRKIVTELDALCPGPECSVCFGCLAPPKDPWDISVTYQELGAAGTYGFIVWTKDGPARQFPITGNPYMWPLLPLGVAIDAAVVGAVLFGILLFIVASSGVGPPGG